MTDTDIQKISEELEISVDELYSLTLDNNYDTVIICQENMAYPSVITKSIPNDLLCDVQSRILEKFLHKLEISEHSAVCLSDKDLIKSSPPSTEKKKVKKCHIYMIYDNMHYDHIYRAIGQLEMSADATKLLTDLCTCNGKLPERGPASRYLLNLIFKKLDEELFSLCIDYDVIYHRNVDVLKFVVDSSSLIIYNNALFHAEKMLTAMGLEMDYYKSDLL